MLSSKSAFNELLLLSENNLYTIHKLEWWLLKHSKLYESKVKEHRFDTQDGQTLMRNEYEKYPEQVLFLQNYFLIDNICNKQRREAFFKTAMDDYDLIKNDHNKIVAWLNKYHNLWDSEYGLFLLDHFFEEHIIPDFEFYFESLPQLNPTKEKGEKKARYYIERKYFEHTIKFLTTFEELYYDRGMDWHIIK